MGKRLSLMTRVTMFGALLLVLTLTPVTTIYLFHPDGAYLGITDALEFAKVAASLVLMQIEPYLIALAAITYAVFNRSVKSRFGIIGIVLLANALVGYFWMLVRNEGGI
ncbi:hypothetical protein RBSWK_01449 [Rhodopirellula baltica SWK14]|uniref:Uncharacterized protein n=1 Tax=Rhodopirellula baltica SWK14 TaxID=993516 RepID=L7CLW9_RHOBT|nr:hypothetical protein RBSWK_01449 [Rhodopirellula baltica SWK14]